MDGQIGSEPPHTYNRCPDKKAVEADENFIKNNHSLSSFWLGQHLYTILDIISNLRLRKIIFSLRFLVSICGKGGIRTRGRRKPTHAFQACAFDRSATFP